MLLSVSGPQAMPVLRPALTGAYHCTQYTLLQAHGVLPLGACLRVLALCTRGSVPPVCPGPASQAPSLLHASPVSDAPSDAAACLCGEPAAASCWLLGAARIALLSHASEPADPGPAQLPGPACSMARLPLSDCELYEAIHIETRLTMTTSQKCSNNVLQVVRPAHDPAFIIITSC